MANDAYELLKLPPDMLKLPPHSVEAEQSVIGGLLLENEALDKIADILKPKDFYQHDHKLIYTHVIKLLENNKPADIVTVAESLEAAAELTGVGGIAYLGSLAQNTPTSANIRRYAEIVREYAVMRQLVEAGSSIADSAYNRNGRNAEELLDQAEYNELRIRYERARALYEGMVSPYNGEDKSEAFMHGIMHGSAMLGDPFDTGLEVVRRNGSTEYKIAYGSAVVADVTMVVASDLALTAPSALTAVTRTRIVRVASPVART